jgi:hypothetical protein
VQIGLARATALLFGAVCGTAARAAVLPEDRADFLVHYYDGGGVEVKGPALQARKGLQDKLSLYATYYVDTISSASIDVVTTASPYHDEREERGVGVDYLYRDTLMSLGYTSSDETDYAATALSMDIAQDLLAGMTTVSLGYSRGEDTVGRRDDPSFQRPVDRWQYRLGLTQVLTRRMLLGINYEAISDEGFLNNPYRSARVSGTLVPERYPATRSSHAAALRFLAHLEARNVLRVDYRFYWDTWEIRANTLEFGYGQYLGDRWLLEGTFRNYAQTRASFYSDNFPIEMNYMARDKELSTFSSKAIGVKASYTPPKVPPIFDKLTLNAALERVHFSYDDFTDIRTGALYSFDANVIQLYISAWY